MRLGGRTPLGASLKPNMNLVASRGTLGLVATVPPGMLLCACENDKSKDFSLVGLTENYSD